MKANSKIFFILTVVFVMALSISVQSADYITNVKTPDNADLTWATQIGEGWQKPAGVPAFIEDNIVIISGDELLMLDSTDGSVMKKGKMAEAQSYGYVAPTYADEKIFMNLSNGTVQALNSKTLESEWVYVNATGGKGMTTVKYSDDVVYTGFWNGETKNGDFVALDSDSGNEIWKMTVNGGFYWSGAYCTEKNVIFGTDDGSDGIAHIYSCDKKTGDVVSVINVEGKGDIRSSVAYCNDRIYVTTKGGYIISALFENGFLNDVLYGEIGSASTSTPVIHNNRIYIGAADKTISVFDAKTLTKLFSIEVGGYPQCTPLISTYYEEKDGYIYLYTTYNKTPGGITLIKIKSDATSSDDCIVKELYDADGYSQYCISDVFSDDSGSLYYKNDSGYLFKLKEKGVDISTSLSEEGFILPRTKMKVETDVAEDYGYTDSLTDSTSALDVLVKIHEVMFEDDFTMGTAKDYLIVSEEGYLSRVMGIDTYNFGYAVNGKAPHDDVLTDYGYTGYSINQASVKDGDVVEFFLYRDGWAMDNYVHLEKDGTKVDSVSMDKGETISLSLKGYTFGWYSCYEDAEIEKMMMAIPNADIMLFDPETATEEIIATTDENGNVSFAIDKAGKYIITVREKVGGTPIIAPWFEVSVNGVDIWVEGNNKRVVIKSNLEKENDYYVIIAEYNDFMLTNKLFFDILLPSYEKETGVDISGFKGDIKAFVWNKKLVPVK